MDTDGTSVTDALSVTELHIAADPPVATMTPIATVHTVRVARPGLARRFIAPPDCPPRRPHPCSR
ncbi:hypothetical protein Rrhod_4124 [Rhodococcus rhodnii LMG 5362]|uniref:Uncharacterized protein n=1 Tax=Rhodococcus rhodnii LMG 5362 TaxID=1273125 RepID=R7WHA1_9NOCA|nr:hypothetical protein Rrhod_4124 [Rhodococcus rhodnii LMG 5362]